MNPTILSKARKGKGKGKKLGFPTANVKLKDEIKSGVYAGVVYADGKKYIAGIFVNPGGKFLEAHLIGFSGNLYDKEIKIEIRDRMRDVIKFENEEQLKNQIAKDIELICSRG